jgi:CheY-like chemotaxis protein
MVNDNQALRRLIKTLLRKIDDEIDECNEGIGAVETYTWRRPDSLMVIPYGYPLWLSLMVIMDLEMTRMDGVKAKGGLRIFWAKIEYVLNFTPIRDYCPSSQYNF